MNERYFICSLVFNNNKKKKAQPAKMNDEKEHVDC